MKGRAIDQLVYETLFPKPKPTDPPNFHALLQRQLVQEVRSETASFYGSLESREAQYPGLDYSYPPHRMRLSRFTWHRRLFRAFDALKLTPSEIAGLTKWEGTKWAKERFEKESGMIIRDTTGDCIHDWVEPQLRSSNRSMQEAQDVVVEGMEDIEQEGDVEDMDEGDDSDMEIESVGLELNERLRAAVAQREAGNEATVMDEEWEQWLKEAAEAGGIPFLADQGFPFSDHDDQSFSTTAMPPRLLNAARLGQWHQIPDFLQNMVRQNIEESNRTTGTAPQGSPIRRDTPGSAHATRRPISTGGPPQQRTLRAFSTTTSTQQDSHSSARPSRRPISTSGLSNELSALRSTATLGSTRRTSLARSIQPSSSNVLGGAYGNARWSHPSSSPSEQARPQS